MSEPINTWFNRSERIGSVAVGALVFYLLILAMVRPMGKHTTGQMNHFEGLVAVAVGSHEPGSGKLGHPRERWPHDGHRQEPNGHRRCPAGGRRAALSIGPGMSDVALL